MSGRWTRHRTRTAWSIRCSREFQQQEVLAAQRSCSCADMRSRLATSVVGLVHSWQRAAARHAALNFMQRGPSPGPSACRPKGHPSLFSASTRSPYWRLVRKGVAPGFSMTSLRQAGRGTKRAWGNHSTSRASCMRGLGRRPRVMTPYLGTKGRHTHQRAPATHALPLWCCRGGRATLSERLALQGAFCGSRGPRASAPLPPRRPAMPCLSAACRLAWQPSASTVQSSSHHAYAVYAALLAPGDAGAAFTTSSRW